MTWEWVVLILGIIWAIVPMYIAMVVAEYKLHRYGRGPKSFGIDRGTPRGEA